MLKKENCQAQAFNTLTSKWVLKAIDALTFS